MAVRIDKLTPAELLALQKRLRREISDTERQIKNLAQRLRAEKAEKEKLELRVSKRLFALRVAALEALTVPRRPDPHLGRKVEPELDPVRRLPPTARPKPAPRTVIRLTMIAAPPLVRQKPVPRWQVIARPDVTRAAPRKLPETRKDPIGRFPVNPCQRCGQHIEASGLALLLTDERPRMHEACRLDEEAERHERRPRRKGR